MENITVFLMPKYIVNVLSYGKELEVFCGDLDKAEEISGAISAAMDGKKVVKPKSKKLKKGERVLPVVKRVSGINPAHISAVYITRTSVPQQEQEESWFVNGLEA